MDRMKGLCVQETNGEFTFTFEGEPPEVGKYYLLEDAVSGTLAQNALFHALTMEYWKSGQHSYNAGNYGEFRNQIKKKLGEGFEKFIYGDIVQDKRTGKYSSKIVEVLTADEIPRYIREDPHFKDMVMGKLKSWAEYTKKQRQKTIDNLITEMLQVGINTKKFDEILKGIDYGL